MGIIASKTVGLLEIKPRYNKEANEKYGLNIYIYPPAYDSSYVIGIGSHRRYMRPCNAFGHVGGQKIPYTAAVGSHFGGTLSAAKFFSSYLEVTGIGQVRIATSMF